MDPTCRSLRCRGIRTYNGRPNAMVPQAQCATPAATLSSMNRPSRNRSIPKAAASGPGSPFAINSDIVQPEPGSLRTRLGDSSDPLDEVAAWVGEENQFTLNSKLTTGKSSPYFSRARRTYSVHISTTIALSVSNATTRAVAS